MWWIRNISVNKQPEIRPHTIRKSSTESDGELTPYAHAHFNLFKRKKNKKSLSLSSPKHEVNTDSKKVTEEPVLTAQNKTINAFSVWMAMRTAYKGMVHPSELFPSEVWNHVFSYLSPTEKSCVRAACTYFRKLIDHPSLWRGWSVVLDFPNGCYDTLFWETLRRRKVTSVVLRTSKNKYIEDLAWSLPGLTTLVMERCIATNLYCLKDFKNSLAIRSTDMTFDVVKLSIVSQPQQLTHLSLCNLPLRQTFNTISDLCQFKKLTSLVFHQISCGIPFSNIKRILASLPKLKHLSLHVFFLKMQSCDSGEVMEPASQLTSLELFEKSPLLSENAMKLMPKLKRFAMFYMDRPREMSGNQPLSIMSKWLSDLHELSTLVIVKGPPVKLYVASIPATVIDLTLRVSEFSLEDMAAVAAQTPHLQHLHLDTWPSHLGVNTSQIPKFFPKLKRLTIRHAHVPEKIFLDLHQLHNLKILEILDSHPDLPVLVRRLRILTKYRLRVVIPPHQRGVLSCSCVC